MKHYVVGFLFSDNLKYVILVKKNRPEWQAGKLNGVGGKIEPNEHPHDAMVREFKEETGADILLWKPVCVLDSTSSEHKVKTDWKVYFYATSAPMDTLFECHQMTDEQIVLGHLNNETLFPNCVTNLNWLIPMAKECLNSGNWYSIAEENEK